MHIDRSTLAAAALGIVALAAPIALAGVSQASLRSFAFLTGDAENPPVETDASGLVRLRSFGSGQALAFTLVTRGLEDVTQSHIHVGPVGVNGPPVAFLFSTDEPVTQNGLLARGVLTADDLIGPLEGMPLSALLAEIEAGNAYVNVHTVVNPGGEIRGQLRVAPGGGPPGND